MIKKAGSIAIRLIRRRSALPGKSDVVENACRSSNITVRSNAYQGMTCHFLNVQTTYCNWRRFRDGRHELANSTHARQRHKFKRKNGLFDSSKEEMSTQ